MSSNGRLQKFKQDCDEAISMAENYKWSFTDFDRSDDSVSFVWNKVANCSFTLCISEEDYPENTLLTEVIGVEGGSEESTSLHNRSVQNILLKLRDDLLRRFKPEVVESNEGASGSSPGYGRGMSVESTGSSVYMECMSGEELDEGEEDEGEDTEMYYNDYYHPYHNQLEQDQQDKMNDLLLKDMEALKLLYGDRSLSYRLLGGICEIDVELNIPLSFLNAEVAEAWKVNRNEPLIVRLHLSSLHYLDAKDPPKVEVLQPSKREKFGVGSQLRKILESFLSEQWRSLNNRSLESMSAPKSFSVPAALSSMAGTHSKDDEDSDPMKVDDALIAQVVDMGFSSEVARNALIITRCNVQEALNLVLSSPESCTDLASQTDLMKKASAPQSMKKPPPPPPCRQLSQPSKKHRNRPRYNRQKSSIASSATSPNLTLPTVEDLSLLPSSTLSGKNAKHVPNLEDGFLVQMFRYTRQRIPTLNEYCVVCDEPHVFQNGAMLKPAVCSRELCVFAFQTLGVMVDAADDIATGAEVVALLIVMTRAASNSARKAVIFEPFPTVVDPQNFKELAFSPKNKDYGKVSKVLSFFPEISEMMRMAGSDLKKSLDERSPLAYPLLQWVIASNRSHIVKLPKDRQLSFMHTPHQFLLMSSPPAKEAKFLEEKVKYGSTFAFHGSRVENWHAIIREGLIVASGTNRQMNGAAYGKGIYLSPDACVSFGYSGMGYGYHNAQANSKQKSQNKSRFLTSDQITCIALCEVVTSPNLKKSGNIWVCPNTNHVCTRFFFVYEDGCVGDNQINTQQDKYKGEIMRAVGYRNPGSALTQQQSA